jgi:hypothetical protein
MLCCGEFCNNRKVVNAAARAEARGESREKVQGRLGGDEMRGEKNPLAGSRRGAVVLGA